MNLFSLPPFLSFFLILIKWLSQHHELNNLFVSRIFVVMHSSYPKFPFFTRVFFWVAHVILLICWFLRSSSEWGAVIVQSWEWPCTKRPSHLTIFPCSPHPRRLGLFTSCVSSLTNKWLPISFLSVWYIYSIISVMQSDSANLEHTEFGEASSSRGLLSILLFFCQILAGLVVYPLFPWARRQGNNQYT